ncbi:MAG: hypothetical protein AAF682_12355 [Planctomycetota bacterium]
MKPQLLLGGLLALALGGVALLNLWPRAAGAPSDPSGVPALSDEVRDLAASQRQTAEVLARLEALLGERLNAPTPSLAGEREPVGAPAPAPDLDELVRSLDELRATLAQLAAESTRTQELLRTASAFGGDDLHRMSSERVGPDWAALELLGERWNGDPDEADRSQYFQTPRDLIAAYGPPSSIYRPKGGLLFVYRRHPEGQGGLAWYFRIQDGIVVEFFLEDEEPDEPE